MTLQWVRLDSAIASNDKILALLADKSPKRWQAAASYMFAIGWSGLQETDGEIKTVALAMVHGDKFTAQLLVKYALWTECDTGFQIYNYGNRQQLRATSTAKSEASHRASIKANCKRWNHGPDCFTGNGCSQERAVAS